MRTERWSLPIGLVTVAVAGVVILVHHGEMLEPADPVVRRVLLVPPVAVLAAFALVGRRRPLGRSRWWWLMLAGFGLFTLVRVVRDVPLVPDPGARAHVVGACAALASWCLAAGVGVLELRRGRSDLLERLLDGAMVTVALATAGWVLVLRPAYDAGTLGRFSVLDLLGAVPLIVVTSALVAGATSGYLDPRTAGWGGLAALGITGSGAVVVTTRSAVDPPVLALVSWTLAVGFTAACLVSVLSDTTPAEAHAPRWRPAGAALACAVPLVLYVVETLRSGPDRPMADARLLGGSLLLLCGGCLWRVARAVDRAERMRSRLATVARSDHLTGLTNRRTADEQLRRLVARGARTDDALSVVMIDLDHFKSFNDRYGHHAGDELLIEASTAWAACLGSGQLLSRYGGEEFLLVATGLAPSALTDLVDRMRGATPRGQTFSAGLAAWDGSEGADSLVGRADHALYEAKATGRGRTCIAYITQTQHAAEVSRAPGRDGADRSAVRVP